MITMVEEMLVISGYVVILLIEANKKTKGFRKDQFWVLHCLCYILMICVMYQC